MKKFSPVRHIVKILDFFPFYRIHQGAFACIQALCLRETGTSQQVQVLGSTGTGQDSILSL